jgi:putative phosphoesterase
MIKIGILSDTHLYEVTYLFRQQCAEAFTGCDMIIHAGDLVDVSILSVFKGKTVHAVHGNTCNRLTRMSLPAERTFFAGKFQIAVTHGTGSVHNIEERVFDRFPQADCIVFGHSHRPICRKFGSTLMINPGSFQATGRYGASGSYGLLQVDQNGMRADIHFLGGPP